MTEKEDVKRDWYLVYASYDESVQGIIKVPATSKEHALELVQKGYANVRNLEVVDICREVDVEKPEEKAHDLFEPKIEKKVLN